MIDEKIQEDILRHLYMAYFSKDKHFNLKQWIQDKQLNSKQVWSNFAVLEKNELANHATIQRDVEITTGGILYTEEQGFAPRDLFQANEHIRTQIMDDFAHIHEEHGIHARISPDYVLKRLKFEENAFYRNLSVLRDSGLLEWIGQKLNITPYGLERVREWREKVNWSEEFEKLKVGEGFTPQQRGHELEKIIEQILVSDGWECERNIRAEGEEHDLIIHREREYYLVECKWKKDSIEPKHLRDFMGKVTARVGVRGIFISMSGYTEAAIKEAADRLESCMISLFGPKDIETILGSGSSFTDLLDTKFNAAVSRREIQVD